jgi:hypothetical protein
MLILNVAGFYLGLMYATWLLFVAIMGFRAAKLAGKLSKPVFVLALPALAAGVLLDFMLQVVSTPIWLDPPRELLLTLRLDRYLTLTNPTGLDAYRQRVAKWVCSNMLDVFESGGHCHKDAP